MPNIPKAQGVRIRDFVGLATNMDTLDRPPTAMDKQKNVTCVVRGRGTVRRGLRLVKWDN